jgi:cytochrome c peroxidase
MEEKKRSRKLVVVLVILVILVLAVPISNLMIGANQSAKLAAIAPADPLYAKALGIMQGKCAECHTTDAGLPFYASLPGVKAMVQQDVDTGLKYIDLTEGLAAADKVPTLRNIAITQPYFHDAGAKDLPAAVKIMAKYQYGKALSEAEIARIAAFLKTLTGEYEGKAL